MVEGMDRKNLEGKVQRNISHLGEGGCHKRGDTYCITSRRLERDWLPRGLLCTFKEVLLVA